LTGAAIKHPTFESIEQVNKQAMRAPVKRELFLFLLTSHHDRLEPVLSGFPFVISKASTGF
jgi:hypothetical protein